MRLSVNKMSFFLFFIIRSTLQRREFCVHSCVTWYEETVLNGIFCVFLRKYDCYISQNLQFSSKVILHTIFTVIPEIS